MAPAIGILMLESRFERVPGDVGNPGTWDFPVLYRVVAGATPRQVVRAQAAGLLEAFIDAGRDLIAMGAAGIATTCGFLSLFQKDLAEALGVPVIASSLMQVAMLERSLSPGRRAGILTISAADLTSAHLQAAGVPGGAPIGSTEQGGHFARTILGDLPGLDSEAARRENVEAALALQRAHPELGAIVLECTNMCPYAADIGAATSLPVHSMVSLLNWFHASLAPPRWGP